MHFEKRLWAYTKGARQRIVGAVLVGLLSTTAGVARLALLGWLIGKIFSGASFTELAWPITGVAGVMLLRGLFEYVREIMAHRTAAVVQKTLRRHLYNQIAALGPGYATHQRSGELVLSLVDGVEQLETYFGKYLPQLMVSALTPIIIFSFVVFIDRPVATALLVAALIALLAP
ncbi:MAG TPA: ABC transporter, partial [Gammaproteobacteria bacterium]|nr:ABC transporter [Gammaproteobacteria bacterium]